MPQVDDKANLIIVESNAKSSTIERILGPGYLVVSCKGHVKDLPKSDLGVDITNGFEPTYVADKDQKKVLASIRKAAAAASAVYLATDPDREGEAISYHLYSEIGSGDKKALRITFNEITADAVREALAAPRDIDMNLVDAQQARRVLDRLVGYLISPILWKKVRRGLSAGRVQSVAVRLLCEREEEIERFVPIYYWSINGQFECASGGIFTAELVRIGDSVLMTPKNLKRYDRRIETEEEAAEIADEIRRHSYSVSDVEKKRVKRGPRPPFITSTLQQAAHSKLGFTASRTMSVAQRLYEGIDVGAGERVGLITYMRTDSTRLAREAVAAARDRIAAEYGPDFLPEKPLYYKTKRHAQDAHEAIRPTAVGRRPESLKPHLDADEFKVYDLIYRRFIACQMADAVSDNTTVKVSGGPFQFRANGSTLVFPGFLAVFPEDVADDVILPDVARGEDLSLLDVEKNERTTRPPARFTEATLVASLEEEGIGRPSTYAPIISTIIARGYVERRKNRLYPTEIGRFVNSLLVGAFPDVFNIGFTATVEEELDAVAEGEIDWRDVLAAFYNPLSDELATAEDVMDEVKRAINEDIGLKCPECDASLTLTFGKSGPFLGCSGYPECGFTADFERSENGGIEVTPDEEPEVTGETCDKCGKPMVVKKGRYGKFLACSGYPECKNTRSTTGKTVGRCPLCGGTLHERFSKKGRRKFYGCENYPTCKFASSKPTVPETCPECGSPYMLDYGDHTVCPNKECPSREGVKKAGAGSRI